MCSKRQENRKQLISTYFSKHNEEKNQHSKYSSGPEIKLNIHKIVSVTTFRATSAGWSHLHLCYPRLGFIRLTSFGQEINLPMFNSFFIALNSVVSGSEETIHHDVFLPLTFERNLFECQWQFKEVN